MVNDEFLEKYYYVIYECRFCGKNIDKEKVIEHQDECKE